MVESGSELLRRRCVEFSVPKEVEIALTTHAGYIAEWRSRIYPNDMTPTKRAKALARIADMTDELRKEVERLPLLDRMALDDVYFAQFKPGIIEAIDAGAEPTQFDLGGFALPRLQHAADLVRRRIVNVGKAGAPPMTERQADFIRCIAQCVKPANIVPTNNGIFRDLCEAVFLAGGMSLPDRAIRYFMQKVRPRLKAEGYCL